MTKLNRTFPLFLMFTTLLWATACQSAPEPAADIAIETVVDETTDEATDLAEEPIVEELAVELFEATAEPEPTAVPPTAEPEIVAREISAEPFPVMGAEGLEIQGTLHRAPTDQGQPAVLLLHMLGGNESAWDEFVPVLTDAGYVVLTIDMRGHGATGGTRDWVLAEQDLEMVWQALAGLDAVDETRTAVVGGSIGSNMALIMAKNQPLIRTAALLSPGLDYRGVQTSDPVGAYGERPLLIVASEEDGYSADSSRDLAELANNGTLEVYDGAGHGTNMLGNAPELTPLLIEWLDQHVK